MSIFVWVYTKYSCCVPWIRVKRTRIEIVPPNNQRAKKKTTNVVSRLRQVERDLDNGIQFFELFVMSGFTNNHLTIRNKGLYWFISSFFFHQNNDPNTAAIDTLEKNNKQPEQKVAVCIHHFLHFICLQKSAFKYIFPFIRQRAFNLIKRLWSAKQKKTST